MTVKLCKTTHWLVMFSSNKLFGIFSFQGQIISEIKRGFFFKKDTCIPIFGLKSIRGSKWADLMQTLARFGSSCIEWNEHTCSCVWSQLGHSQAHRPIVDRQKIHSEFSIFLSLNSLLIQLLLLFSSNFFLKEKP